MYNFDQHYEHPQWDENKWRDCHNGEIPMWVAVMDFALPECITSVLKERLEFPFFGYDKIAMSALNLLKAHYASKFNADMENEWAVLVYSVMTGMNVACMMTGGKMMYCTPMYTHIRKVSSETDLPAVEVPLKCQNGRYEFDFDAMEKAMDPSVKSFILCNPHNPVGRVYSHKELLEVAEFCKKHDLLLISDEIHCELTFEGTHIPAFVLEQETGVKTVTLSSAGKICNIPRLPMGFAIIPDDELRKKYEKATHGLFARGETLNGLAFTKAFDGSCDEWKEELRAYLKANRDYMESRIAAMPGIDVTHNEATYLAWIDCRDLKLPDPAAFFRKECKIIFSKGEDFGVPGFVRINFACQRDTLKEALDRMEQALVTFAEQDKQ